MNVRTIQNARGQDRVGYSWQNASISINCYTCLEICQQFYVIDKCTGICKCTENQVVEADFATHKKCLMSNAGSGNAFICEI